MDKGQFVGYAAVDVATYTGHWAGLEGPTELRGARGESCLALPYCRQAPTSFLPAGSVTTDWTWPHLCVLLALRDLKHWAHSKLYV